MLCTAQVRDSQAHHFWSPPRGVSTKIPPSTRQVNRLSPPGAPSLASLREELAASFRNHSNLEEDQLFTELSPERQRHNNLPLLDSPLFSPSDLPPSALLRIALNNQENSTTPPSPLLPRTLFPSIPDTQQPIPPIPSAPDQHIQMEPKFYMPARGERMAPTFDKSKPRELIRFFEEFEFLLERAHLEKESEKKKHVLRYVEFEVEQIWKTFPEFSDDKKTYEDFKNAILVHYPDASGDYVFSLRDMDLLIGERHRLGVSNTIELADFHLKFITITTWLIEKEQLGTLEQQRGYLRAFQTRLLGAINNRLQMKFPDQHPNKPHTIQDVYEAARFILQSATTAPQNYFAPTPPTVNPPFVPDGAVSIAKREPSVTVKNEEINTILSEFSKTIIDAINLNSRSRSNNSSSSDSTPRTCNFCAGPHFIRDCVEVETYIKEGKCKRNTERKIVLPTGAYVPREIPGNLLKERIEEWHRRYPNQLATVSLLHTIGQNKVQVQIKPQEAPTKYNFQLSTSDRIATIEAELFNLRSRNPKFVPLARTRAQKARAVTIEEVEDEDDAPAVKAARQVQAERTIEEAGPSEEAVKEVPVPTNPVVTSQSIDTPEHPYQSVKDAAYAPPATRNVGAPVKPPTITKKNDPAYKTLPPVHDPSIATEVYKRSMDAPITITQRELLSLSPEVRSQVRDVTTTRRVPNNAAPVSQNTLEEGEMYSQESMEEESAEALHTRASCCRHKHNPPWNAISQPDPIERYIRSLPSGQEPDPDRLIIAKDSSAVRSIFAIIDSTKKKECILDSGCQIVAMAEDVCHDLSLVYDPTIKLNMQSANGTTDWSLGLARNVPFTIGTITLYLQVHIIKSPAYDILLGRPFEILTESITRNFANEDQTITITDPNSGQRHTIPTFPRGHGFRFNVLGQDFQVGRT